MYSAGTLNIDLRELKAGLTQSRHTLDDAFFEAIDAPDVHKGELECELSIRNNDTFFEVSFSIEGTILIPCDRCLEDMEQAISTEETLIVKFGQEYSDEDEIIIVDEEEGILDLEWLVYEAIVLNIPIQHVHAPGKCDAAMMKLLSEHTATRSDGLDDETPIDPRWSKLADLMK